MRKEFWLIQDSQKLQLPVPPPNYFIEKGINNSSIIVENIGEITLMGKPKLAVLPPIASFFPAQPYSFCQYTGFPTPDECIDLIEGWLASGKPIRFIITNTKINLLCSIENFKYGEPDGTGDVSFELTLKEYKVIQAQVLK